MLSYMILVAHLRKQAVSSVGQAELFLALGDERSFWSGTLHGGRLSDALTRFSTTSLQERR